MPSLLTAFTLAQAAMPMSMPMEKPEPVCIRAGDLPPTFAKWNASPAQTLGIGVPFVMIAAADFVGAMPPRKPGNGAVASFTIRRAGTYRIALSNGAWIDVVQHGKPLASVAHDHGPLCTGLRKIVDFRLPRGTYALQLGAMPAAETKVLIVVK